MVACPHLSGKITDHTVQAAEASGVRYVWRGACSSCNHGVVGSSTLPSGLSEQELASRLTSDLIAYLNLVGGGKQAESFARAS